MIVASPSVKASTTGHGTNARYLPTPAAAMPTSTTPATTPTTSTPCAPYRATIGTSTTVIAPVGPDTWTCEPPNTAATRPAMIAVTSPARAPSPVVIPNASASGSATTLTE